MSRIGDFLIDVQSDSEFVIGSCESFEQFCSKMKKINDHVFAKCIDRYMGRTCWFSRRSQR